VAGLQVDLDIAGQCLSILGQRRLCRPTIRSASLVDYVEVAGSVGLNPYEMMERVGRFARRRIVATVFSRGGLGVL
jgi:hypothetical protein